MDRDWWHPTPVRTLEEAREAMLPILPVEHCTPAELDALAGYIWSLRTQDHF